MEVIVGSARIDERGKLQGGAAGDQKQTAIPDYKGEVSMQSFYVHKKGWYILRPKSQAHAKGIAKAMKTACNNRNIGYDQTNRGDIWKKGTATKEKSECDCSSLIRQCIKEATGKDPGNFTTANEADVLEKSGLFEKRKAYNNSIKLKEGDVLVTKERGHTVAVTDAPEEKAKVNCYKKYAGDSTSIVDALKECGEKDTSFANRSKIAFANGIPDYVGAIAQNLDLLDRLKKGTLKKA